MAEIAVDVAKLRDEIRTKYIKVVEHPEATFHFHTGLRAARNAGYLDEWLEGLPKSSIASFAGVANPFHWGLPRPGERVVDVGSGTGMDAMVAANAVGAEGRVVGVDMTPEMLERAREGAEEAEIPNVEFREGLAEQLPVDSGVGRPRHLERGDQPRPRQARRLSGGRPRPEAGRSRPDR